MKKLLYVAGLLLSLGASSCDSSSNSNIPKNKDLKAGGIYVAYVNGCKTGCDQISKGDLIQSVDGAAVKTGADFDKVTLTDGASHKLEVLAGGETKTVEVVAQAQELPPLKDVPPFWTVAAEALNQAPDWARRRMFGHASPMMMLVNVDGGILDGRQLYGKKRFMIYWDWGTRTEQAQAITFMKVLQKAQGDLQAKGIEPMFIHLAFPSNQRQAAMNDSDLREFMGKWSEKKADGTPYPVPPSYRWPNRTEYNEARQLGLENAFTVYENLGSSPTIVLMDERGVIRWHSEGVQMPPPGSEVTDEVQYTIIEAVKFSLEKL